MANFLFDLKQVFLFFWDSGNLHVK
jgi:hypothetical protein